jgi:hypothetical protein
VRVGPSPVYFPEQNPKIKKKDKKNKKAGEKKMLGLVRSAAEDDPRLKRKAEFMARHRRDYGYGGRLDRLRSTHFSRLRGIPPPPASPCSLLPAPPAACCGRSHGRHTAEVQGRCIWTTPEPRYTRSSSCEQSQSTSR